MTLVGKILTFLILIMSIVFMTFTMATYATHRNWREVVDGAPGKPGLKGQLENAKKLLADAELAREEIALKLQRERASRSEALASKETANALMAKELADITEKYATIEAEHRKNIETVNMAQNEMERAKTELLTLRKEFQTILSDRNSQLAVATEVRDKFQKTVGQLAMAERKMGTLTRSLSDTKLQLDQGATGLGGGGNRIAGRATLDLDGRVTAVGKKDLVVVSLGSDEGLRSGDKLEVYRSDGSYVGRLVVVETKTDTAVARIVPEYLQGAIQRGDAVATNLL